MEYYGGRPAPHTYPGPQGQGPAPGPQMYGNHNQAPQGSQGAMHSQGGHFNEYNSTNMHPAYGQQSQEYFEPQQQMYDPSHNPQGGLPNSGMGTPMDPRSNMMMQQQNPGRSEPTKILRNPFPEVPKEMVQRGNEIYDPSVPTGPPSGSYAGHGQFNQQRHAPPPPNISGPPVSMSGPQSGVPPPAPTYENGMPSNNIGGAGMYGNNNNGMYGNNSHHQQVQAPVPPASYQSFPGAGAPFGNSSSNSNSSQKVQQEPSKTMQVMTGIVTQVKPGSFGMVSEEIFFQEHVVSGPLPRLGDKVVVEAEPVSGMPFKFNAKRVTRLDMDLVHEEKGGQGGPPPPQAFQQQQPLPQQYPSQNSQQPPHSQFFQNSQPPQHYQNPQPPQHYHNPEPPQQYPPNRHMMDEPGSRFDPPPNFGPLPSLPDSLNLPKPVPPPNLASIYPSSGSEPALKSILKRKGSPSLKRNPPPPPVISKKGTKKSVNPFKTSAPSSLKQNVFSMDLEQHIPRVLPPHGNGPPIEFPEYTFQNTERPRRIAPPVDPAPTSPRITRLLPRSPIPEFNSGRSSSVDKSRSQRRERSRSRDRNLSPPARYRSRSKSPGLQSIKGHSRRRSRSRSVSPSTRRSRRSRSRSRSVSPSTRRLRRSRSRSRSKSPSSSRRRRYSQSPSPRGRRRSRSISPRHRRRTSRSASRDRSRLDSRESRNRRTAPRRSRSTSRSRSKSPYRGRYSPDRRRSRSRSHSPRTSAGVKVLGETVTHGIVVRRVCSDLFPKLPSRASGINGEIEVLRRDGKRNTGPVAKQAGPPPGPIKFQIANPSKPPPVASSSLVPNPTFKAANMAPPTYLQNPVYNITKTVVNNTETDAKNKKKKPKEQEPAFRVVDNDNQQPKNDSKGSADDKIKQWEAERLALKSKTAENPAPTNILLKNPVNILQLKQTIQKDLSELRSKNQIDVGKKLLQNPTDIERLKQAVQRDLQEIKTKENVISASSGAKEIIVRDTISPVINKNFDENVEQRLKDLRSKFENHIKDAKATDASTSQRKPGTTISFKPSPPPAVVSKQISEKQTVSLVVDNLKNNSKGPVPRFPNRQQSEASSDRSRGPPPRRHASPPPIELPPYDERMERLQEEIHQQRFLEEEQRLKSMGDQNGLHQLYYMEDRRRRRMDERQLARIRMTEIQLKKDKKFGELAQLREEWGPPAQRLEQERELRQCRMNEEQHENQLHGQAEAIRRQEYEYQRWLEEEAAARSRNMQGNARASKGCEGRVLRRRTPSPSSHRTPLPPFQGPPPEIRGSHPLRRHSRSPSFDRYKQDWHRRHPRDRSPPMNYEEFTMRYPTGPPPGHPMHGMPPDHPDFHGPPSSLEQEGFFISRAMDDVARRQDELMQREMEVQRRLEMAQRRYDGGPSDSHPPHRGGSRNDDREEVRRFIVPRR